MSQGGGWGTGKIVLVIVIACALLGALCCGGVWMVAGDKIAAGVQIGTSSAAFQQKFAAATQPDSTIGFQADDQGLFVVLVGVKGEDLTPERIAELQDLGWVAYCDAFEAGGFPVASLAVGKSAGAGGTPVLGWSGNKISVEDLEARTGRSAPPVSGLMKEAQLEIDESTESDELEDE